MIAGLKYLCVGFIGLACGLLLQNPSKDTPAPGSHQGMSDQSTTGTNLTSSNSKQVDSELLISERLTANGDNSASSDDFGSGNSGDALNFIDRVSPSSIGTAEFQQVVAKFDEWITDSETPAIDIVSYLQANNEMEQKHVLEYLISSKQYPDLSSDIVSQLGNIPENDIEDWVSLLQLVPIDTDRARNEMIDTLPSLENSNLIAASIDSITPSLVPPADRDKVLSNISTYVNSDDESVRSAALSMLGAWSATDYAYLFEDALASGDENRIILALRAAGNGSFSSNEMHSQKIHILSDESASLQLRQEAFNSLSDSQLTEEEYWIFYEFYNRYIKPVQPAVN